MTDRTLESSDYEWKIESYKEQEQRLSNEILKLKEKVN